MKRLLAAILTLTLVLSGSTVALAKQADKENQGKGKWTQQLAPKAKDQKTHIHQKDLDRVREQLTKKVDDKINQLKKLRSYIVSDEGKVLIEMVDAAAVNEAIKTIDNTVAGLNAMKTKIKAAVDSSALNTLAKTLDNDWKKNQFFMKRINGIAGAAKVYNAYLKTKALVDKLVKGLSAYSGSNAADLKKRLDAILTGLESAKTNYKEALSLYLTMTDSDKTDKTCKTAQDKLKKANKELHETLKEADKLLRIVKQPANAPHDVKAGTDRDAVDRIAPTITSVVRVNDSTIIVTFSEKMKQSTLTSALSGFSVSGGNAKLNAVTIPGGVDTNTLLLTGSGFEAGITRLNYNASAGLTDMAGNKLAAFIGRIVTRPR